GHGIALSSDLVIQGASQLTSSASGVATTALLPFTALFSVITGFVAVSVGFYLVKRDMKNGKLKAETSESIDAEEDKSEKQTKNEIAATVEKPLFRAKFLAWLVPITLLVIVSTMIFRS